MAKKIYYIGIDSANAILFYLLDTYISDFHGGSR